MVRMMTACPAQDANGAVGPGLLAQCQRSRPPESSESIDATIRSTGALSVVLGQTPNRFRGLETIGKVFFILDLILFVAFSIAMTFRFVINPRKLRRSIHHPVEGLFFGAYWVSLALILNCTQIYGVPSSGPWLIKALEVLFWMYCAVVFVVGVGQYYLFFQRERLKVADAMPAWVSVRCAAEA
jgi:tellurite resistance protein TehA-like permease